MKKNKYLGIIIIIFILGIGYAYLNTTLNITGTTDFDSNTWNVYWDNVQVTSGSVSANTPTIDTNKTTVSFSVHFTEPGEKYEFTVDAKNTGSIPAVIEGVTATINGGTTIPEYLKYTVSYEDDFPLQANQILSVNQTQTYKVRLEYRNDIDPSDLPDDDQSLSLTVGVNYIQSSDTSQYAIVYSVGDCIGSCESAFILGQPIPEHRIIIDHFSNVHWGNTQEHAPAFFRFVTKNDIISEAYSGLRMNGTYYYFRIGGATYNESTSSYNNDSIYYEDNKRLFLSLFDNADCAIITDNNTSEEVGYDCQKSHYGGGTIRKNGEVGVGTSYGCGGNSNGMWCGG